MATTDEYEIIFHHAPWSRAAGVRWLLEELGVSYEVSLVNVHNPETIGERYRAIQPHKKVPAIEHGPLIVTERAAITIYLADAFPRAGLAPTLDDPMRAAYLTMLVYCDAVFDPCVATHYRGLRPKGSDYSFGTYDDMLKNIERRLTDHPFAAGERFTAADTQLASSLGYTMNFLQAVPRLPVFEAYLERVSSRPAHVRAQALDEELARKHVLPQTGGDVVQEDAP